jgi:hypothetical protein
VQGRPPARARTHVRRAVAEEERHAAYAGQTEEKVDEKELESALESKTVRFTWDAKAEKYDVKYAGEDGAGKLLEGLAEDTDFRGFLPKDGTKVGDTWKLDGKSFNHLLDIGGDLHFADGEEKPDDDEDFSTQINENMSGDADVKFEEMCARRTGSGWPVISFKADFKSHAEMAQKTMHADVKLAPEGEHLWDLELNACLARDQRRDLHLDEGRSEPRERRQRGAHPAHRDRDGRHDGRRVRVDQAPLIRVPFGITRRLSRPIHARQSATPLLGRALSQARDPGRAARGSSPRRAPCGLRTRWAVRSFT